LETAGVLETADEPLFVPVQEAGVPDLTELCLDELLLVSGWNTLDDDTPAGPTREEPTPPGTRFEFWTTDALDGGEINLFAAIIVIGFSSACCLFFVAAAADIFLSLCTNKKRNKRTLENKSDIDGVYIIQLTTR